MRNMGANLTTKSIAVAAKSISIVNSICEVFENDVATTKVSSNHHPMPSFGKDFDMILQILTKQEVFVTKSSRSHASYKQKRGLLQEYDDTKLTEWLTSKRPLLCDSTSFDSIFSQEQQD